MSNTKQPKMDWKDKSESGAPVRCENDPSQFSFDDIAWKWLCKEGVDYTSADTGDCFKAIKVIRALQYASQFQASRSKGVGASEPFLRQLRRLSVQRAKEGFKTYDNQPITYWTTAIIGELGELCNMIKKMKRAENGGHDSGHSYTAKDITPKMLREEVGGTLIYIDLLCSLLGIDMQDAIVETFNEKSIELNFPFLLDESAPLSDNSQEEGRESLSAKIAHTEKWIPTEQDEIEMCAENYAGIFYDMHGEPDKWTEKHDEYIRVVSYQKRKPILSGKENSNTQPVLSASPGSEGKEEDAVNKHWFDGMIPKKKVLDMLEENMNAGLTDEDAERDQRDLLKETYQDMIEIIKTY